MFFEPRSAFLADPRDPWQRSSLHQFAGFSEVEQAHLLGHYLGRTLES